MERVGSISSKVWFLLGLFIVALAFSAAMPSAEAGTVFARSEPAEKLQPGESYPESRFGQAPARLDFGVSQGYASRAVEDMEASDEDVAVAASGWSSGSRSPAGLVFSGGTRGRADAPSASGPKAPVPAAIEPSSVALRKGVQEVAVIASDLGYFPKTVFVSRDVPVRLFVTSSSKNTLCLMMDSFQVRKQVRSQKIEEITFTPNMPGKYRFYCPVNGMDGTLVVREFSGSDSEAGGASVASDEAESRQAAPARRAPASEPREEVRGAR